MCRPKMARPSDVLVCSTTQPRWVDILVNRPNFAAKFAARPDALFVIHIGWAVAARQWAMVKGKGGVCVGGRLEAQVC